LRWLSGEGARRGKGKGKGKHGERRRHHGGHHGGHHKSGSGHSGKRRHHREHRGERGGKEDEVRGEEAPEIQAPKAVHVREMAAPVLDILPLSRTVKDMQGMLPETHQGKGKQRDDSVPGFCRLCAQAPEYRPGNRLCETCMQLAFEPRNGAESGGRLGGGKEKEGLRIPFTSPTHSAEYYTEGEGASQGEFDPSDPRSVHPAYRNEGFVNSSAYERKQVKNSEKATLAEQITANSNRKAMEMYEPMGWRQKGKEKEREPDYITYSREEIQQPGFLEVLQNSALNPYRPQNDADEHSAPPCVQHPAARNPRHQEAPSHDPDTPSTPLTIENLASLHLNDGPPSPASVWEEVRCTEKDSRAHHSRRSATPPVPPLPDYANPTVAAGSTAFHIMDRFRRDLNRTPSPEEEERGRTGYTHIVDAYARDYSPPPPPVPRISKKWKALMESPSQHHGSSSSKQTRRYSPPSPSIYNPTITSRITRPRHHSPSPASKSDYPDSGVGSRGRQPSGGYASGDIADASPLHFDDRDARRLFDPLNPHFMDPKANGWFKGTPSATPSIPPPPVAKDTKFTQGRAGERGHKAGKEREHEQRYTPSQHRDATTLRDAMQSQGHYTDRRTGNVIHLPPAKPPPRGPLPLPPRDKYAKQTNYAKPTGKKTPMMPLPSNAPFAKNGPVPTAVREQAKRVTDIRDFSGIGARASETLYGAVAQGHQNEIERRNATRSPEGTRRGRIVEKEEKKEKKEKEKKVKGKWWLPGGWK